MRSIKRVLFRALAITFFSGLTLGAATNVVQAAGMESGAGGHGHPGVTEDSKGSGGGGARGSEYNKDNDYSHPDYQQSGSDYYYQGGSDQSGSGAATGGSTESEVTTHDRGTTVNGVFWPDYSHEVGTGSSNYWEK